MPVDSPKSLADFADKARGSRPLLLLDADEVLLAFVEGVEKYAAARDLSFKLQSFAITGNLIDPADNRVLDQAEVKQFLADFFRDATRSLALVKGAKEAVERLSAEADIAVLSNVPDYAVKDRIACLRDQGLTLPVFGNEGGKGVFVRDIQAARGGLVCFVDDLPPQHDDVERHAPDSHRLHFVADKRLQPLIPKANAAHARIDDWSSATEHLLARFNQFRNGV